MSDERKVKGGTAAPPSKTVKKDRKARDAKLEQTAKVHKDLIDTLKRW